MPKAYVPIFYDWPEVTGELNAQEKGRLIDAIVEYARGGDWQEQIKGNERYLFPAFRQQIDRAEDTSMARASAGAIGGKQAQANASKTEQTQAKSITNKNTNKNTNKSNKESDTRATRFTRPTIDEVKAYAQDQGYSGFNAQRFIDYYESKGWTVGKAPMKSWQASVRNWVRNDYGGKGETASNPALNYSQHSYTEDDFADLYLDLNKGG